MPTRTNRTKRLTRQGNSVLPTESTGRGSSSDVEGAPLAPNLSVDQCRRGAYTPERAVYSMFVPVVDSSGKPLMPTTASRARRWIKRGEATPFFRRGIFCVRLNREPSSNETQDIAIGIDPGSKREAFTVKSEAHTFLNIQAEAVQHVSEAVETRRNMRRARRFRKTPCRANRANRARGNLPPSTKARWQWKLRIVAQIAKMFPVTDVVVEDIKAKTKGRRRWDKSFSPLEVGKKWFYESLKPFGRVHTKQGFETFEMRNAAGLKKSKSKLAEVFEAHCVDSWVLANWCVGGHVVPENKSMLLVAPIRLKRRQLHMLQPAKGGVRKRYGGTRSLGFKRGSLVKHPKFGICYVGGTMAGKISLHSVASGVRATKCAKTTDCRFLTYNTWRMRGSSSP